MAMRTRARTEIVDRKEVDFSVLAYSCVDGAVTARLGNHSKEIHWKVQAGTETRPIDIKVHVDKTVMTEAKARIECDGERIFPGADRSAKLWDDFIWKKPFRGLATGIGVKHFFEVHAAASWYPATLTKQRDDGLFEAVVTLPDLARPGEYKEMFMPGFAMEDIREAAGSKQPLQTPQKTLQLLVPKKDPMHASLSVEDGFGGQDLMTHYFARPTPVPGSPAAKVQATFKVNKARSEIVGDMGHVAFQEFLKNDVYFITKNEHSSKKMEWTIAIGMDAVHTLTLEKKWKSKIATLSVDGALMIESTAEDLDCPTEQWECKFLFKGERVVNFDVHETNVDGDPQDTTSVVQHKIPYSRECSIKIVDDHDVRNTQLFVDGIPFSCLKPKPSAYPEGTLTLTPQAFSMSYPIAVPFKVNKLAPRALEAHVIKAKEILVAGAEGLKELASPKEEHVIKAKEILVAGAEGLKELASPKLSGESSQVPVASSWLPRLLGFCSAVDVKKESTTTQAIDEDLAASKH